MSARRPAARAALVALALLALTLQGIAGVPAVAEEIALFRIGSGGTGGTYYPVARLVAQVISNPGGACRRGESCGMSGLVAVAQSSTGSVANVDDIASGRVESGFVQSDVAYWAYNGAATYAGRGSHPTLRAIANLYPESFHIVVRRDSGIGTIADLAGKRVALDQAGSGTLVGARLVLAAFGLDEKALTVTYLKSDDAMALLVAGELDAVFLIAGYPARVVEWASERAAIALLPIAGAPADALIRRNPFLRGDLIPAGVYEGVEEVRTVSVAAQWITRADVSDATVYGILRALWRSEARDLLDRGHAKGRSIRLETALEGIGIPLHDGALRFYREVGLLPQHDAAARPPE